MKVIIKKYQHNNPNAKKTLAKSYLLDDLISGISAIGNSSLETALKKFKLIQKVYLWDIGVRAVKHLEPNALLVLVCGNTVYYGDILTVLNDDDGDIGEIVGWGKIHGRPWKDPTLLVNVKMIKVPLEEIDNVLPDDHPNIINGVYIFNGGEASEYLNRLGINDCNERPLVILEESLSEDGERKSASITVNRAEKIFEEKALQDLDLEPKDTSSIENNMFKKDKILNDIKSKKGSKRKRKMKYSGHEVFSFLLASAIIALVIWFFVLKKSVVSTISEYLPRSFELLAESS